MKNKNKNSLLRRDPKALAIKRKIRRAQPIHKRMLLHPISILALLCTGVFIVCWTYTAVADNYSLTAKVAAPSLTEGATITSPKEGDVFTQSPITVSGTCPTDSYVKLYRNGTFSGTAVCSNAGTFQITTSLFPGQNVLVTQAFNITDDPGPDTPSVTVTYNPPAGSPATPSKPRSGSPAPAPLFLLSDFEYQTFTVGETFEWGVRIEGGTSPYTVSVDWGDGHASTLAPQKGSELTISHVYKKQGYFVVLLTVVDADGSSSVLQLAALIKNPGATGIINAINCETAICGAPNAPPESMWFALPKGWLWLAWPSFGIVSLMAVSFWLGERQEFYQIFTKKRGVGPRLSHR